MQPRRTATSLLAAGLAATAVALPLFRLTARHRPIATVGAASSTAVHAPVTVTLYHDTLTWRTDPWLFVDAVVTHTEGLRVDGRGTESGRDGRGHGRADGTGAVAVRVYEGTGRWFRPFDVVTLSTASFTRTIGTPYTFAVPELRVDVAADGTAVEGRAAPGARVALTLDAPPGGVPAAGAFEAVAGPDGRFRVTFDGGAHLAPGQGGWAAIVDAGGNTFRARFAAFQLRLRLTESAADGWLTPADVLSVHHRRQRDDNKGWYSHLLRGQSQTADGRRTFEDAPGNAASAGALYTVTVDSPVLGTRARSGLLPSLTIDSAASTRVEGTAPPSASLWVEVFAADAGIDAEHDATPAPIAKLGAVAGSDGRWRVDLPELTPLRAGSRVEAVLDLGDGLEVVASALRPRFTIAVDAGRVVADASTNGRYRFTLSASDGARIGRTRDLGVDIDGRIVVDLSRDSSAWAADPQLPAGELSALPRGGSLEVDDAAGGDPLRLTIPRLSATADVEADAFAGTAPPSAALDVEVIGAFGARRFAVTADATGAWALPLARQIDVRVGVGARVWTTNAAGHRFYVDSAPVRIVAAPDSRDLAAGPATGRPLRAEVIDPAGRLVARVTVPAHRGPDEVERRLGLTSTIGSWLVDRLGQEPPMQAGDTIRVRVGDDGAEWVLPPIEGRIDPERDIVAGKTLPATRLEIIVGELDDPLTVTTTVTADTDGIFRADLAGKADVSWFGGVTVRGAFGPHTLLRGIDVPAMTFDIDRAQVTGSLEPDVDVEATLWSGATVLARGRAHSDARAHFGLDLSDDAGAPVIARADGGERLVVEAPAAKLYGRMTLDVPAFSLSVFGDGRTVGGARPASGQLWAYTGIVPYGWPTAGSAGYRDLTEQPADPGSWRQRLSAAVVPGVFVHADLTLPSGHVVQRVHVVPILGIEQGGTHICGIGPARSAVNFALVTSDGGVRGSLASRSDSRGRVDGVWLDAAGRPVEARAGDEVVGHFGDVLIDEPLDVMTATLDLPARKLIGQIRPGARPILTSPARDCLFRLSPEDERWLASNDLDPTLETYSLNRRLPTDGRIDLDLPAAPYAERGYDLHIDSAGGHRIYRPIYHALVLEADVASGRLAGRTRPHADVRLTVRGADGAVRAEVVARADAEGTFDVASADAAGRPVGLHPGDRVTAVTSLAADADDIDGIGFETATMTVEALDVDPSAAAIVGTAPGGRTVGLSLDAAPVGRRWIALTAAPDGRFALRAEDVPPRSGWTLADVTAGRVELAQAGGHRTVAGWTQPTGARASLFLPWGRKGE